MSDWADKRERRLMAMAIAMLAVVLAWELYRHLNVKPVALPVLLVELREVALLVACVLLVRRAS